MLKRVDVEHLCPGMFVHEFCGSWMEHPFLRTRFLLNEPNDLERLRATTIRQVWIDTSKGLDIPAEVTAAEEVDSPPEETDKQLAQQAKPSSTSKELHQARAIIGQARETLKTMLHDVRLGRPPDLPAAGQLIDEMTLSIKRNPHALISLARLKTADNYSYMHSIAVGALMIGLARRMGHDDNQVRQAGLAGLLHDVGKTRVPLTVLNKPGPLDPQEWAIMKSHAQWGYEILQPLPLDESIAEACLHHHEKIDGSGYPDGLKQSEISLLARMASICDVYDAVTSDRPYKEGWQPAIALQRMAQWTPQQFDKSIFQQFVQTVGIYPLGSLVRLQSEHLAIVLDVSDNRLLTPQVRRFYCLREQRRITPGIVDLALPEANNSITGREDPADWPFKNLDELWHGFSSTHSNSQP
ncbi:HD-GYP domain-containing protein [Comamonas sp. Y33R10-2]|uniref:HD-GYP domain-containing protein n=1 Tax=Comamonas sp. Y33R10-2 TaxID=2853257 RepID=UPI001C5CBA90|nr:HD-GYP domain-containing protein [Comamonas sp. Y33R10-2]QXZ09145.1 HD-GYP domain-containing protein [Comamonas sp. Y33R10-2]